MAQRVQYSTYSEEKESHYLTDDEIADDEIFAILNMTESKTGFILLGNESVVLEDMITEDILLRSYSFNFY